MNQGVELTPEPAAPAATRLAFHSPFAHLSELVHATTWPATFEPALEPQVDVAPDPAIPITGRLASHRALAPALVALRQAARRLSFLQVTSSQRWQEVAATAQREAEARRQAYWQEQEREQEQEQEPVVCAGPSPFRRLGREVLAAVDVAAGVLLLPFRYSRLRWGVIAGGVALILWGYAPTRVVVASVARPLRERAAFLWEERFERGLPHWVHAAALSSEESGAVRVQGLALHSKTMALRNYEMNFSARVQKKAMGWVVRAAGRDNYYVFKLADRGRAPNGRRFELVRYPVLDGCAPSPKKLETVPVVIRAADNSFLDISVRVTEDQILTTINGFGVDAWKHPKLKTGGVGFLAENGESFLVRSLTISGNEDALGLILYGAEETLRSVRRNLMSLAASRVRLGS